MSWCELRNMSITDRLDPYLIGLTVGRQTHATIHQGGVVSEHGANLICDIVHSQKEKRWAFRSHLSRLTHVAVLLPPNL